ncbi:MAG TPA: WD40 repeat domain-containing protein [Planctomycetaceae bacterium]|nr:WD40 repeat domain-containing protein [Planctomycetaceae bacterium]
MKMNTISSRVRSAAPAVLLLISTCGWAAGEPEADHWGDSLPEGAVARLGTLRFRVEQGPFSLAFSPHGDLLAAAAHDGVTLVFDARTGRRERTIDMVAEIEPGRLWRAVRGVCFSPDGTKLALANPNGQIHLHDVETGRLVETLAVHREIAESLEEFDASLRFSPDGKLIAALYGMKDAAGDAHSGCVVFENGIQRSVFRNTFAITPCLDGAFLALKLTVDQDAVRDVQVLDLQTGKLRGEPLDVSGYVPQGLSPDGTLIAALRRPQEPAQGFGLPLFREIALIDAANGAERSTLVAPENERFRYDVAFTPDGRFIITTSNQADHGKFSNAINCIQLWEIATSRRLWSRKIPGSSDLRIAFSADGQRMALGFYNNTRIRLLNVTSGDEIKPEQTGHDCGISAIALSRDGRSVVTGDWSQRAIQWDLQTGRMDRVLAPESPAVSVAWSPDGKLLATASRSNVVAGMIARLWNAPTGRPGHALDHGAFTVWGVEFGAEGRRLITLGYDAAGRRIRLTSWDAETGQPLETIVSPGEADKYWPQGAGKKLALSPGGQLAVDGLQGPVRAWSLKRPGVIAYFPGQFEGVRDMRFSADGTLLFCVDRKDAIRIWEVASGYVLADLSPSKDAGFTAAAFSPDGELIASAEDGSTSTSGEGRFQILVRHLPTRRELARLAGHESRVRALAFSPDGSRLLSGHSNGTTLVWVVPVASPGGAADASRGSAASDEELWEALAEPGAATAVEAMEQLVLRGADTVRFLGDRLKPVEVPDEAIVSRLIHQLDDDDFGVRRRASAELRALGRVVEPHLRTASAESESAELRGRCQQLLRDCESPFTTHPLRLREVRAVQVLARIGSSQAMQLIEKLLGGAADAEQTQCARALVRLRN